MSNCGYKTKNVKAKLFAEVWHMEILERDIATKEQEVAQLKQAQEQCANEIERLEKLVDDGVKEDDTI